MLKIKHKIVREYEDLVKNLNVGKTKDYSHIIDMINLIDVGIFINNSEMIAKKLEML